MSEQINPVHREVTRAERKQLLALACAADRVAWVHSCRPPRVRSPAAQIATEVFKYLEPFSNLLPGRMGKWLRGASVLTSIGRHFGWMVR
jgi:hypothetical protein